MTITERIQRSVEQLTAAQQAEVLHYAQYLLATSKISHDDTEECLWSDLSLASAMRGMEDEGSPQYTKADLKITF